MVELNTEETIVTSIIGDNRSTLEVILKDPAFDHTVKDLIDAKNKDQIKDMIADKFLEGYHHGLMMCYNLLKQYDRQQVYDAIDSWDGEKFYKEALKSLLTA